MNVYTAIGEFALPQIGVRVHVGDTIGKILTRGTVYIEGSEVDDQAVFDWVGTLNSALYLTYTGIMPDPPVSGIYTGVGGSQAIVSGESMVVVSGLTFGFVPTSVVVTVLKPDGSASNIFATVRQDSITDAGFTVDFSSAIPDAGYSLAYFVGPLAGQLMPSTNFAGGSVPIGLGVAEVTVTQAFGFTPTVVVVTVTKPDAGGFNIFATVKEDSISATGFAVDLSGVIPATGYILNYFVK